MTFFWHQTLLNIISSLTMIFDVSICIPRTYLSDDVSYASNEDRMQMLRPREIDVLTYPNGAHINFGAYLLGLGFWMSRVFDIPVYCKNAFKASL
jgi:hypothetical protein